LRQPATPLSTHPRVPRLYLVDTPGNGSPGKQNQSAAINIKGWVAHNKTRKISKSRFGKTITILGIIGGPQSRSITFGDIEPMQEAAQNVLLVVVTLFPIVDPLGGSPFFLALTRDYSPEARKALSWRIAVNSFILLVATYFVGTYVLEFFGISLPVVQVGGGLIVIATGWTLLKQRDDENEEKQDVQKTVQPQDTIRRAFYPLTLPLTVGPASISAAITLGANAAHHHSYHPLTILAALIGLALIAVSILLCYGFADRLARILGATGMTVITQLSSFLLVCIGVQIAWNGIKALLESLTLHIG
jgi:multiple antibiotic resistance protein